MDRWTAAQHPHRSLRMSKFDTYNAKTTSVAYPWPADVTGIERIALSAQGDLQRVLSAFFARPIVIALVYSHTLRQASSDSAPEPLKLPNPQAVASASPSSPITQTRQVHLQCGGKIACTATSIVRITSPEVAHLFLEEKYAIGQMFRRMEKVPAFELLSVGIGPVPSEDDKKRPSNLSTLPSRKSSDQNAKQLWRKYKLVIPDFECEILEVFPDRDMFADGDAWVNGEARHANTHAALEAMEVGFTIRMSRTQQRAISVVLLACLMVIFIEVVLLYHRRSSMGCWRD
ncbi:hypothetical protein BKA70DRAFT_479134 [Coprinopsis sp. MPI-PUGE-AT-0042]|nr:hypothetical protein BKA70DRAFT_479134 [Coprinopsis sp. MPI-PUGE-AT-0042]